MTVNSQKTTQTFSGLLAGLTPGHLQARGLLDIVALLPTGERATNTRYVSPLQHLQLVRVPRYGTLVLKNAAQQGVVIAPMHIGFFQVGAQNHATSRVLILGANQTREFNDCFCIQESQGGLLKEAQQRFIVLPLGLRKAALQKRKKDSFSRLWEDIDVYNRRYGIARGGHLERFLRPYFPRLQPFRHAFETLPQQVGAAYFVAGRLVGVEVTPNPTYWQDMGPILNIYCYGTAALLAERLHLESTRQTPDMEGLVDLDDLAHRLACTRTQEKAGRVNLIDELSALPWSYTHNEKASGLRIQHLHQDDWVGQVVKDGDNAVYLSLFRDIV